ncbi:MAG: GntR family transcriptional regulator [Firmicutes bacterium]|nr:GntR family transcriptional regulator [Bacillota bacterium]
MVDKNKVTPLYVQIADELRNEIISGKFGTDGCIGTHQEISDKYGVSLRTGRAAVLELAKEGLVNIRQGKGSFVRSPLVDTLKSLTGSSSLLKDKGISKQVDVPVYAMIDTPGWLPREVQDVLGEKCVFLSRIISVENRPISQCYIYLPPWVFPHMSADKIKATSVFQIYQDELGVVPGIGRQIIKAAAADETLAGYLKIPVGSPVLRIERRSYDVNGSLIEYMIINNESNSYSFEIEMELNKTVG